MKVRVWVGCSVLVAAGALTADLAGCGTSGNSGSNGNGNGDDAGNTSSGGGGSSGSMAGASSGGGSSSGTAHGGSSGASSGSSGGVASSGGGSSSGGGGDGGSTCLQAGNGDYASTGPYTVATTSVDLADAGLSGAASPTTFTIYYPSPLESNCPHPIAAWGNGTGVTGQQTYAFFNNNVASWGIVVIASDNSEVAVSPYLSAGVDYLVAQNANPSSIFYQKLSAKAGVAGHSQGGGAATTATSDSHVVAEVCVEGFGVPKSGTAVLCLTGSQIDGGPGNINSVNGLVVQQTYPGTTGPGFLADWDGGDHVTTPTLSGWFAHDPGTIQFVRLMTAWYRCYLAGDGHACSLFQGGTGCGICSDPGWYKLESKNF